MREAIHIGIDGCKAGWFVIGIRKDGRASVDVFGDIEKVITACPHARQILIDIPIGLPHHDKRRCDFEARKVLSPRRSSSVFPVPSRNSLYASTYEEACQINLQLMGNKLSKQTWNIRNKITEVDSYLRRFPQQQSLLRECHPEVAFWNFNGQSPMVHSKKTAEGRAERLGVIRPYLPFAQEYLNQAMETFPRKILAQDDILDAMILAISATFDLKSLPKQAPLDRQGLAMEIVYADLSENSR